MFPREKPGIADTLGKKFVKKRKLNNVKIYLSTAPVIALTWISITAGLLIEINRFFPDPLVFSF
jgi:photosystem I subunit 9